MKMSENIVFMNEELYSFYNFEQNVSHNSAYLLELSTQSACAQNFSAVFNLCNEIIFYLIDGHWFVQIRVKA